MKIYRQLEPGETIPENAVCYGIDGFPTKTIQAGELQGEHPARFLPLPVSDDPDAGAKAAAKAYYPHSVWHATNLPIQNAFRAAATAAVAATVPGLVADCESFKDGLAMYEAENKSLRSRIAELEQSVEIARKNASFFQKEASEARAAALELEAERPRKKLELLQKWQSKMRDPERTIVCDILANGQMMADPNGTRYGIPAQQPQPPKLVPATLELMQRHGTETVRYRNGEKPKQVALLPGMPLPIVTQADNGLQYQHRADGTNLTATSASNRDLLMPEPAPRMKELWVAVSKVRWSEVSDCHAATPAYLDRDRLSENKSGSWHIIRIEIPEEEDAQ